MAKRAFCELSERGGPITTPLGESVSSSRSTEHIVGPQHSYLRLNVHDPKYGTWHLKSNSPHGLGAETRSTALRVHALKKDRKQVIYFTLTNSDLNLEKNSFSWHCINQKSLLAGTSMDVSYVIKGELDIRNHDPEVMQNLEVFLTSSIVSVLHEQRSVVLAWYRNCEKCVVEPSDVS